MRGLLCGWCLLAYSAHAQVKVYADSVVLRNPTLEVHQTLQGPGLTALLLANRPVNPFAWRLPVEDQPSSNRAGYDFRGHFVSVGTWGAPTAGQQRAGVRLYGDINATHGQVEEPRSDGPGRYCRLWFEEGVEQLSVRRELELDRQAPVLRVTEHVTNHLPVGRPYNLLQHATFGGEFVDRHLLVNTNAGRGFYQKGQYPRASYDSLEATAYHWPRGQLAGDTVDLRYTGQLSKTYLSSHVFSDTLIHGWAVAANPQKELLVGYWWSLADYPWLNVWQQYKQGKVRGRALEFATCGLGVSFQELIEEDHRFFDRLSFEFIDAGETITKSYYLFAQKIPRDFRQMKQVRRRGNTLELSFETPQGTVTQRIVLKSLR